MDQGLRRITEEHVPARDRLTCSCGWEALDGLWVDHLRDRIEEYYRERHAR